MKSILSYSQPEFYSFSEDSIHLANFVEGNWNSSQERIDLLDLGSGCGVVGLEVAMRLKGGPKVTFLELQKEFLNFLHENIERADLNSYEVIQNSIGEQSFGKQTFDIIVSNPPYFNSGDGRASKNLNRQLCRTFEIDGWDVFYNKIYSWMDKDSVCFLSLRNLDPLMKFSDKLRIDKKESIGGSWLIRLSALNKN